MVCPSIPGYGVLRARRATAGGTRAASRGAFAQVMAALGYDRYGAQGGDWGSMIASQIGAVDAEHVVGRAPQHGRRVPAARHRHRRTSPTTSATRSTRSQLYQREESGYASIQGTKPQTIGYALDDSPVGLAAWIVEKFRAWSDCDGDVERSFTKDQLLDNVMLYWLTAHRALGGRLYYEVQHGGSAASRRRSRCRSASRRSRRRSSARRGRGRSSRYDIVHWTDMPRGGHFAAFEVPDLLVPDVRAFFAPLR